MPDRDIQLVTFDLGNVLVFVDEGPPAAELARLSGRSVEEAFAACFSPERKRAVETGVQSWGEFAAAVIGELKLEISAGEFREIFDSALTPDPAMGELVEQVAERHRIALCSNTSPAHADWARRRLPYAGSFDPAIVSYEVGVMKPERGIFEALVDRSGVAPEQIFFVDDVPDNVEGARAAGINAVQFTGVERLRAELARAGVRLE